MLGGALAPAGMGHQQRQRGRRDAVDASRLPDGARADRAELLPTLLKARAASHNRLRREARSFVPPIGFHIRRLALHIDVVFGFDLQLLRNGR